MTHVVGGWEDKGGGARCLDPEIGPLFGGGMGGRLEEMANHVYKELSFHKIRILSNVTHISRQFGLDFTGGKRTQ